MATKELDTATAILVKILSIQTDVSNIIAPDGYILNDEKTVRELASKLAEREVFSGYENAITKAVVEAISEWRNTSPANNNGATCTLWVAARLHDLEIDLEMNAW